MDGLENASVVADEPGALTVSAYDGGHIMATFDIFESRVYVRRADHATGDFSHRAPRSTP